VAIPRSADRGHIEAEPLLLGRVPVLAFRDQLIAATLKRRNEFVPTCPEFPFRDQLIAATLKLPLLGIPRELLADIPRSADRGHIEAAPVRTDLHLGENHSAIS